MKLLHGTDNRLRDRLWVWSNRAGELLTVCLFLASLGCLVWFIIEHESILFDLILVFIAVTAPFGFCDASWRNSVYRLDENGITIRSLLEKKRFSWNDIIGWGVFPVRLVRADMERDYIFLFLKEERPDFPVNLMTCGWRSESMITIRKTDERLAQIETYMDRMSIKRL